MKEIVLFYPHVPESARNAAREVLNTRWIGQGPRVDEFEQVWFEKISKPHRAIAVGSGTDALHLAYILAGIGPGDEVVTPVFTCTATTTPLLYQGAKPIFADIKPDSLNIDPKSVESLMNERIKAIVCVHYGGLPCDMDELQAIADKWDVPIIEDAAQAHQAEYKGARVGGIGDIGCFSFYPHKNLGAYGDGGAVTTNDADLAQLVRALRYMGQREKHKHEMLGFQERLDELQAAILSVRLRHLAQWTALRQRWAALYDELLADTPVVTPARRKDRTHVYYMYTIKAPDRDGLMAHLKSRGIGSQIIYPTAVPDQGAYAVTPCRVVSCERARSLTSQILCLPVFPELREEEVRAVAAAVSDFYATR